MATVTRNDSGGFVQLQNKMKQASSSIQVKAGFFTPEMASIARLQNYGGIGKFSEEYKERARAKGIELPDYWHIVPRMFMNVAFDNEKENYGKVFAIAFNNTHDFISAANTLGMYIKGNIKDSINERYQKWASNAPVIATIKGKNTPLRDHGDMWDSVNFEVVNL